MSRRPGVLTQTRRPAPSGESPNAYYGELSAELRCHWTPTTPWPEVMQAILDVCTQALVESWARHRDAPSTGV